MRQQWADYRTFWREFRRAYQSTGAVLPSGPALAVALCRYVREGGQSNSIKEQNGRSASARISRRVLEVGPGTGAVTAHIVRALRLDDRLVLVERNEQFVARLRERLTSDPELRVAADRIRLVHASVEELSEDEPFDVVVSGLPLNNFPAELVEQILAKLRRLLAPGATLSFFEYVGVRRAKAVVSRASERQRLRGVGRALDDVLRGNEMRCDLVLANVPPAWVHHVRFPSG